MYSILALVLVLRYLNQSFPQVWSLHFWPFTVVFAIWMTVFYIAGLYDSETKNDINFYTLVLRTILINAGLGILFFYVFSSRLFSIRPQVVLLVYLGFFSIFFLLWRRLYNHLTQTKRFSHTILFIGGGTDMDQLAGELVRKPYFGYRIADYLKIAGSDQSQLKGVSLRSLIEGFGVDTVVTSPELHRAPAIVKQLYENLFLGISYFDLPTFYEKITGRVPTATIGQVWFLENLTENEKKFYELSKRFIEVMLTLAFCAVGIVLSPLIAVLVKLDSSGPILFKQKRIGCYGKPFLAMKFRTMVAGSDKNGPQWTHEGDARITRLGRILRKTKLDEIPQFINVLRGEMSLIGPRPEQPEFVNNLTEKIPYYNIRHLIKPGLMGWAQIHFPASGASEQDTMVKLQYDLYYIKNRSFLLDLGIVLKTINTILSGAGR